MSGKLQRLRVDNVNVRWRHGQHDAVGLRNVLGDEVPGLFLDIGRLISNGNLGSDVSGDEVSGRERRSSADLGESWQVDQGEV